MKFMNLCHLKVKFYNFLFQQYTFLNCLIYYPLTLNKFLTTSLRYGKSVLQKYNCIMRTLKHGVEAAMTFRTIILHKQKDR